MNRPSFVHLHLHSQFSLLESTIRIESLMARLKELQMPAVALTDKGNLFGAIPFYQSALSHGLKPILGCEIRVSSGEERANVAAHPLVLLAQDEVGYQNLIRLSSDGYFKPMASPFPWVDRDFLAQHSVGLIALSGGHQGRVDELLRDGNLSTALKVAGEFQEIFGKDRFFLEIQDYQREADKKNRKELIELARKAAIPLVVTNSVHYLRKEDAPPLEALLSLKFGAVISADHKSTFGSEEFYLKSPEEMARLFSEIPEALAQTLEIAERCHLLLEFGKTYMPAFPVPDPSLDEAGYLAKLAQENLERRYGAKAHDLDIRTRMDEELSIIRKTGFSGYFLIVWDIITKARQKGIPVGPGRGSAAGSLVSYLIGITDIDPIRYDLLFERFINPERVSAPDIDVDVCDRRRQEVLEYIVQAYGKDRVASIVTFGTMAAKAVIRDVGRVMGIPLPEIDHIAKLIPWEPKITLEDAAEKVPELANLAKGSYRKLWETCRALEGLVRHVSTHAAGVLIGSGPLLEMVPLCQGAGGETLTQYDMNVLKDVGLLKLDILGLRTLTVIDDAVHLIKKTRQKDLNLSNLPLDDAPTFKLLKEAKTYGIFQVESRGMRDYIRKLEPETLEDLIALLALYRPGPLGSDMVDDFIHRKKGLVKVEYLHPKLEPILKTTYGVILYQEQVMRIAKDLAGFSLGQADLLRRAMGSKNSEKMEQMRGKFLTGAKERHLPADTADAIFNQMAKFAGYGFNKSHSAAYALVAYQTAYLKANFGPEFMTALLTSETGNQDKVSQYVFECKKMGIPVPGPDVNASQDIFSVEPGGKVRFSLSAIKNVGTPSVAAILEARRKGGPFKSFQDFFKRVDLKSFTPKMVECLISAGAFDFTGTPRAQLKAGIENVFRRAQNLQVDAQSGQTSLFETMTVAAKGTVEMVPEASPAEILMAEKEVLGFYLSGHPLSEHEWELEHYVTPMHELEELPDGFEIRVAGLIRNLSKNTVKKTQETYGRFTLEDLHSHVEVLAWPEVYRKHHHLLVKDSLVALKGRLDRSGDRVQVIANEVIDMNEMAVKWAKGIHLTLNVVGLDDTLLPKVRAVCQRHPGKARVYFHMQTTHHGLIVLEAGEDLAVRPSKGFLREIYTLLGEESIEIEL